MKSTDIEYSIILPCLNEEKTLGICIRKIHQFFSNTGLTYEIIVADNGSTDNSALVAKNNRADVILELSLFIERLQAGYDMVMGNRFAGGITKGAMPWLHRYVGNPFLSSLGRFLFKNNIGDFHCGLRAFTKKCYNIINPQCNGMEFASELVALASIHQMRICEIPVTLYPDGRKRRPHLRSWRDGFRHMVLLYSLYLLRN